MKLLYICSPYRATDAETLQRNVEYAKALTRTILLRGDCPVKLVRSIANHHVHKGINQPAPVNLPQTIPGVRIVLEPMIKCKKTPKKKCRFMAERKKKR